MIKNLEKHATRKKIIKKNKYIAYANIGITDISTTLVGSLGEGGGDCIRIFLEMAVLMF